MAWVGLETEGGAGATRAKKQWALATLSDQHALAVLTLLVLSGCSVPKRDLGSGSGGTTAAGGSAGGGAAGSPAAGGSRAGGTAEAGDGADGGASGDGAPCSDATPGCMTCPAGQVISPSGCLPSNACEIDNGGCAVAATCTPSGLGMRTCACNQGYEGDGITCTGTEACKTANGGCADHATCIGTGAGTRTCTCAKGYSGDGLTCTSVNSCLTSNGGCSPNAVCTVTGPGTNSCACNANYKGDGITCTGLEACAVNNGRCATTAACTSTGPNTRTCACTTGYTGDGVTCSAVNSCLTGNGGCSPNATCASTGPGTNTCTCKPNYTGDGKTCSAVQVVLSVMVNGPINAGSVVASTGGINCGNTCTASVASGSSINLVASPTATGVFVSWSGCTSVTNTMCTVAIGSSNISVTASFKTKNGGQCGGNSDCSGGFCVGGVCCNSACSGPCNLTCQTGTCQPQPPRVQCGSIAGAPGSETAIPKICDGSGNCIAPKILCPIVGTVVTCDLQSSACCNIGERDDRCLTPATSMCTSGSNCNATADCPTNQYCCLVTSPSSQLWDICTTADQCTLAQACDPAAVTSGCLHGSCSSAGTFGLFGVCE